MVLVGVLAPYASAVAAEPPSTWPSSIRTQLEPGCAAFDSRVWAQTVYDQDPGQHGDLDPDGDGLACEELELGAAPALWTHEVPDNAVPAELVSVTDGDTIEVIVSGKREPVRLVGTDAPEAGGPYQDVECFGPEASTYLAWLAGLGGDLYLERDQEERDPFGRLLRWVWLDLGGEIYLLNEAVIRAGYAERFRNTPNRRYLDELVAAEAFARRHGFGQWRACSGAVAFAPSPSPEVALPSAGPSVGCDPAYPDVCILPPPPDLDCGDIPHAAFRVLPPDPHNFDGNQDGVGCEGPR